MQTTEDRLGRIVLPVAQECFRSLRAGCTQ